MSSPGGMCEQGSGVSRNQLFLSLFTMKWTVQEIVLSSVNFQFSWITVNINQSLCCPLPPPFCPALSPQMCQWPRWHPGIPAPWRSCVPLQHLPLPQKVSKVLGRGSDVCFLCETCVLLLSESCVYYLCANSIPILYSSILGSRWFL